MATTQHDHLLAILATCNEAQARWLVAKEVLDLGRGGLQRMHKITGMSRPTIIKGMRELREGISLPGPDRVRRPGAGRKRLEASDPEMMKELTALMEETTAGDPMTPLRWTTRGTDAIAKLLTKRGHPVSADTVGRRLHEMEYSLQTNAKAKEGRQSPDRDAQFQEINRQVAAFLRRGEPVLSIDSKKKERVGNFKNAGRSWRTKGDPIKVLSKDFPDLGIGAAIPYGAYDIARNHGFVNVGMTHETAEFAVESLRRWWRLYGRHYAGAKRLLLCADGGGANGSRRRTWKANLQALADELCVEISVCHYPPGASKWNKIEHRMFSYISIHWRGEPLITYETVLNLISSTRTAAGLRIKAVLDHNDYPKGIKVTDAEMRALNVVASKTLPEWNYTVRPHAKNS